MKYLGGASAPDGTDRFVLYGAHSDGNSFLHPRDMDPSDPSPKVAPRGAGVASSLKCRLLACSRSAVRRCASLR